MMPLVLARALTSPISAVVTVARHLTGWRWAAYLTITGRTS